MTPRPYVGLLLLATVFFLASCAIKHPATSLKKVVGFSPALDLQGHIAQEANSDSVIPFDIVLVHDKKDAEKISQMDAEAWFGPKGRCNFRGGPKAQVQFHSWEFVPGQSFHIHLVLKDGAQTIYAFARYSSPGKHRIELLGGKNLLLSMEQGGISIPATNPSPQKDAPSAPEQIKVCPDD